MKQSKTKHILIWLLIILWPLISTIILLASTLLRSDQTFISEYDVAFFTVLMVIVASHAVAFCTIPLLTLTLFKLSKDEFFALKIVGVFVIFLQTFFRAITNTFFVPRGGTPNVMSTALDNTVTTVTIIVLVGTLVGILYVLRPRDSMKSSKFVR